MTAPSATATETIIEVSGTEVPTIVSLTSEMVTYDCDLAKIDDIRKQCAALVIAGPDDKKGYNIVNDARKSVKALRCKIQNRQKDLKKPHLELGRLIDSRAKELIAPLEEIEEEQEKKLAAIDAERKRIEAERAEAARVEAARIAEENRQKVQARLELLKPYTYARLSAPITAEMTDDEFGSVLHEAKHEHQAKLHEIAEADRKAEEERKAREKADAELAVKLAEVDRLRQELEAKLAAIQTPPAPAPVAEPEPIATEDADEDDVMPPEVSAAIDAIVEPRPTGPIVTEDDGDDDIPILTVAPAPPINPAAAKLMSEALDVIAPRPCLYQVQVDYDFGGIIRITHAGRDVKTIDFGNYSLSREDLCDLIADQLRRAYELGREDSRKEATNV